VSDLGNPNFERSAFPRDIVSVVHCAAAIPYRSNVFEGDNAAATTELGAMLGEVSSLLVRAGLARESHVIDDTDDMITPSPVFVNRHAKRLHPKFRKLADHLLDAA
jgi:hypothetical protein